MKLHGKELVKDEQYLKCLAAVRRFRDSHKGRAWKQYLNDCWQYSYYKRVHPDDVTLLQYARNAYGPVWLDKLRPKDLEEA